MLPSWLPRREGDGVEPAPYALPRGVPALQSDPAVVRLRYTAGLLLVGVCAALVGSAWAGRSVAPTTASAPGAELRKIRERLEAARACNSLARLASVALIDRGEGGRELAAEIVDVLDAAGERADDLRRLREALVARAAR